MSKDALAAVPLRLPAHPRERVLSRTPQVYRTSRTLQSVSVRRRHVGSGPARRSSQPRAHEQANDMLGMGMAGCACAEGRTCGRLPPPRRAGQTGHAGDRWADMNVRPARSRTRRGPMAAARARAASGDSSGLAGRRAGDGWASRRRVVRRVTSCPAGPQAVAASDRGASREGPPLLAEARGPAAPGGPAGRRTHPRRADDNSMSP